MRRLRLTTCAFFGLFIAAPGAFGQCQYEVTAVIQAPPCPFTGPPVTVGHAMNEQGHVVGRFADCATSFDHAFVWTPESGFAQLPQPADVIDMVANDINDNGVIVGTWTREDVGTRGFVFDPRTEEYTELPPQPGGAWNQAFAINNAGQVAGRRSIGKGVNPLNAYIWSAEDGFVDLEVPIDSNSAALDICTTGAVGTAGSFIGLGILAFHWHDGQLNVLTKPRGTEYCGVGGINTQSMIVGSVKIPVDGHDDPVYRPAVWQKGKVEILPGLSGFIHAGGNAVNDQGVIAGTATIDANNKHAFVYVSGNIADLNQIVTQPVDGELETTKDINSSGQILIRGTMDNDIVGIVVEPVNSSPADLDGDCIVTKEDLIILLNAWANSDTSVADINNDGSVNVSDLLFLLVNWG